MPQISLLAYRSYNHPEGMLTHLVVMIRLRFIVKTPEYVIERRLGDNGCSIRTNQGGDDSNAKLEDWCA